MAEGEATVAGTFDGGGEGTGARMVGGSLPPRKRLLAGLKQNGSWLASSSPASPTAHRSVHRVDGGGPVEEARIGSATLGSSPREGLTGEAKGGCMSCGALESDVWRKAEGNGVVQRLCDFCNFSLNKSVNSCRCQAVYPDVKDPEGWSECRRCRRVVHVVCEQRVVSQGDGAPYVCLDCVYVEKGEEHVNPVVSTGAAPVRLGSDFKTEAASCALPAAAAECSNPCRKKTRISREPRSKSNDVEGDDVGQFEETCNSTKVVLVHKGGSSSKEAAAAAAATAAAVAGRAAAAAKASAAAKAATAVRAAAIARAALDAAALAAKVEAQFRGEFRRNSFPSERTAAGDGNLSASQCQIGKERQEESAEGMLIPANTKLSSIDDEELARQLHRAINSSPRISSGLTPVRRKPSTKPVATLNVSHTVASWPRPSLSTEGESRLQMKQQQTRPRSLQVKEVKLIDDRELKLESRHSGGNSRTKVSQQHQTVPSGNVAELLALKSEPVDSSTATLVKQNYENTQLQGTTVAPSYLASKKGNGCANGATAVSRGAEDSHGRVLSATDVSQAAVLLDEVLMSEVETDEASRDEYLSRVQDRTDVVHRKEDLHATATTTIDGGISLVHTRPSEDKGLCSTEGGDMGNVEMSGVVALVQVASGAIESLETQGTSASALVVNFTGDVDVLLEDGAPGAEQAPLSTPSVVSSKDYSDFESSLEILPKPAAADKEQDEEATARGKLGAQEFASGQQIESSPSALPIRAPPLGSALVTPTS